MKAAKVRENANKYCKEREATMKENKVTLCRRIICAKGMRKEC